MRGRGAACRGVWQHGERLCGMWHVRGSGATLSVEPLGPSSRSRRLTKRSLLRHSPPILMMSHAISSSSRIFRAWVVGARVRLGARARMRVGARARVRVGAGVGGRALG